MQYSTAIFLASLASMSTSTPLSRRDPTQFPAGTRFDIVLQDAKVSLDDFKNSPMTVLDIDLFDNSKGGSQSNIAALAQAGTTVICYFSAGSREDWRPDASDFQPSDYGQAMDGWPGENWLNLESDNVKTIMTKRIQMAKAAGCSAIDPDNVDGYVRQSLLNPFKPANTNKPLQNNNQDGFGYDQSVYVDYINWLGSTASSAGLATGLKNAIEIISDVIDSVQFAVNEQCHQYSECDEYEPFTAANKAVFNIEYKGTDCSSPSGTQLSIVHKPLALDSLGGQC